MEASVVRAAVIGLGSMGMGIARSLRRAGFDVVGCDADPSPLHQLCGEVYVGRRKEAFGRTEKL